MGKLIKVLELGIVSGHILVHKDTFDTKYKTTKLKDHKGETLAICDIVRHESYVKIQVEEELVKKCALMYPNPCIAYNIQDREEKFMDVNGVQTRVTVLKNAKLVSVSLGSEPHLDKNILPLKDQ